MRDEEIDLYMEAGKTAKKILDHAKGRVKEGLSILEFVEEAEAMIIDAGASIAFPLNVSLNEDAAHDTASPGDERIFSAGDVIKVDMGAHVDGYIADTAITVDLGDNALLLEASREALEAAIRYTRPGVTTGEIGAIIQHEIESRGFLPVSNLTGHGLSRYEIHTAPSIPNIKVEGGATIEEGMVIAIEPFASTGNGYVTERNHVEIFSQVSPARARLPSAKAILKVARECGGLPFARRWVEHKKVDMGIGNLLKNNVLHPYPTLHDRAGSLVSQHEHTLIVTDEGCIVTTK